MLVKTNNKHDFINKVERYKQVLTKQQIKTLIGQATKGEIEAAEKGLSKLLKRISIAVN
jgi:hypothetical protein